MKTGIATWRPSPPPNPRLPTPVEVVPVVLEEAKRRPLLLAGIFTAVAIGALLLGLSLPKVYTSSTTIQISDHDFSGASNKGRSGEELLDRAAAAREVAFSHKVMSDILVAGGWMDQKPSEVDQERLINQITGRTSITSSKQFPDLIRISYSDASPLRAYKVTQRLGELIIQESATSRARESRDAFKFIDSQVTEYRQRMAESDAKLADFYKAHPEARAGTSDEVSRRISDLRRAVDNARMDLVDASATGGVLRNQMSSESPLGVMQSRASQNQVRMAELQAERDRLLLNYTPQHPDVVRIQHQMDQLASGLGSSASREMTLVVPKGASSGGNGAGALNPVYGQLKGRLAEANSRRAASASRVAIGQGLLQEEISRSERLTETEAALTALTRDYEINRGLYEDLVKQRESARVAMNRDSGQTGLNFRVQEPTSYPLQPSGKLRLAHVAAAGLVLAIAVPVLVLLGWLRVDPRVRTTSQIEQLAGLPVLGSVPSPRTPARAIRNKRDHRLVYVLILVVPLAYGVALAAKLMGNS
jgi:polysaccharide chain length determinant protein (PEP-CTERM system associated)